MSTTNEKQRPPGMPMRELVAATGLPRSTLLYYVDQGLLPKPVKTSPNMAYYPPECVERAGLIKRMQERHRLPLARIRKLLYAHEQGRDLGPYLALDQEVFPDSGQEMGRSAFLKETGLKAAQLKALEEAELILPLEPGRYDQHDVAMGRMLVLGLSRGISPQDLAFYPRLAREIVDQEMALRSKVTHELPMDQDAEITAGMVQAARTSRAYIIDRVFQRRIAKATHLKDQELLS